MQLLVLLHLSLLIIWCSSALSFNQDFLRPQGYDRFTAPFEVTGVPDHYYVYPSTVILVYVDETDQIVSFIAEINLTWFDPRLVFNATLMGYNEILVRSELLWMPPVTPFNAAEFKFLDKHYSSDDVAVNSSGWISKFVRGKIDVACRCDVCEYSLLIKDWRLSVNFPFDTQYCNIDLDIGIATSQWAILHEANISSWVIGLPEWDLYQPTINTTFLEADNRTYSAMIITFPMKRNSRFYIFFLIMPTVIITNTCITALLAPLGISSGDRVSLGISGMLGFTFMLSIVVVEVPRSEHLPLIGKWFIVEIFYILAAMLWDALFLIPFVKRLCSQPEENDEEVFPVAPSPRQWRLSRSWQLADPEFYTWPRGPTLTFTEPNGESTTPIPAPPPSPAKTTMTMKSKKTLSARMRSPKFPMILRIASIILFVGTNLLVTTLMFSIIIEEKRDLSGLNGLI